MLRVNLSNHWFSVRNISGQYYNLDSKYRAPMLIESEDEVCTEKSQYFLVYWLLNILCVGIFGEDYDGIFPSLILPSVCWSFQVYSLLDRVLRRENGQLILVIEPGTKDEDILLDSNKKTHTGEEPVT